MAVCLVDAIRAREGQPLRRSKKGSKRFRSFGANSAKVWQKRISGNKNLVRRLGVDTVFYGHNGSVNSVNWDIQGNCLLSAGDDCTVTFWDVNRQYNKAFDSGHTAPILWATFMPFTPECVVTCGMDRDVRVSHLETQVACVKPFRYHTGTVSKVVFQPGSASVLYSCSLDGTIKLWDLREKSVKPKPLVHLQRESKRTWKPKNGVQIQTVARTKIEISSVAINPQRTHEFAAGCADGVLRIYDARKAPSDSSETLEPVHLFFPSPVASQSTFPFRNYISGVSYNHSGSRILASYSAHDIYMFSTQDDSKPMAGVQYKSTQHMNTPPGSPTRKRKRSDIEGQDEQDEDARAKRRRFTEQIGLNLASIFTNVRNLLRSMHSSPSAQQQEQQENALVTDEPTMVPQPTIHQTPATVASHEMLEETFTQLNVDDLTEFWRTALCEEEGKTADNSFTQRFRGHQNFITSKEVSFFGTESEYVITGSEDGLIFIWEAETGEILNILQGDKELVHSVQGHPQTVMLASSGYDGTVKLWTPVLPEAVPPTSFDNIIRHNIAEVENTLKHRGPSRIHVDIVTDIGDC